MDVAPPPGKSLHILGETRTCIRMALLQASCHKRPGRTDLLERVFCLFQRKGTVSSFLTVKSILT